VDSPGGSYVASDSIWREVSAIRDTGKPVIVSMGNLAASGGYFISCIADTIVAQPGTLTGSIGVFGGKPVVTDLLDKAGLSTGAVAHGNRARMFSPRRPFSEAEWERLDEYLDAVYDDFTAKVAAGRQLSRTAVEDLARGRVWTGADAHGNGLVDVLGSWRDAAELAREHGGLAADAPLRPAVVASPLAMLKPATSSDDPRAAGAAALRLELPGNAVLQMPPITLR
jgi:protease-4